MSFTEGGSDVELTGRKIEFQLLFLCTFGIPSLAVEANKRSFLRAHYLDIHHSKFYKLGKLPTTFNVVFKLHSVNNFNLSTKRVAYCTRPHGHW